MADARTIRVRIDAAEALDAVYEAIARRGLAALPPELARLAVERMGGTEAVSRAKLVEVALVSLRRAVEGYDGEGER